MESMTVARNALASVVVMPAVREGPSHDSQNKQSPHPRPEQTAGQKSNPDIIMFQTFNS